jgi:nucleolar GTP-binding protein
MRSIPSSKNFIDVVLSQTQRKTPTVIHKNYAIQRVREFYIRKVKFFQQNCESKLVKILQDFPQINQLHPFFNDLLHILIDKNNYKLSLNKILKTKFFIKKFSKNYIKLLKYANSVYACKQLKKNVFGKICSNIRKIDNSLVFLEKIRICLKKLPSLNPCKRIIVLGGSPGTGKSSLLNKLTSSNIKIGNTDNESKGLRVGHFTNFFFKWQILDTIGINCEKIKKYNSFEMQTINAYVHLNYNLIFLFNSSQNNRNFFVEIKTFLIHRKFFRNKPKILILGKTDIGWEKPLGKKKKALINFIRKKSKNNFKIIKLSIHDEVGFINLRDKLIKISYKSCIKNPMYKFTKKYFSTNLCEENRISIQKSLLGSLKKIKKKSRYEKKEFFYTINHCKNSIRSKETIDFFKLKKKNNSFEDEEKIRGCKNENIYLFTDFKKITKSKFDNKNFLIKKTRFYFSEFY